jgi:hypothetical protein
MLENNFFVNLVLMRVLNILSRIKLNTRYTSTWLKFYSIVDAQTSQLNETLMFVLLLKLCTVRPYATNQKVACSIPDEVNF